MPAEIRKTLLHVENTLIEGGKPAEVPLKMIAAVAVIKNPWAGQGFVEDLRPEIHDPAFGENFVITPNIDRIASKGIAFSRAYCQQAICGPTRNSFLSGRRPIRNIDHCVSRQQEGL